MKKFQHVILLIIAMTCVVALPAQNKYWRTTVGLGIGTNQYAGELGNDFYSLKTVNPFTGLHFNQRIAPHLNVMLRFNMGSWGYDADSIAFHVDVMHTALMLRYNFISADKPRWQPYVFAGIALHHYGNWSLTDSDGAIVSSNNLGMRINADAFDGFNTAVPMGAGVQVRLAERVFLSFDETMVFQSRDNWDGWQRGAKDLHFAHTISIGFGINGWADTDGDGISDKQDKCNDTPKGVAVNELGCIPDRDMDGIGDYIDACPDQEGAVTANGCPDEDADGIADTVDKCPKHKGTAAFNGCPDSDDDGVIDTEDECPSVKGEAKFNGCIDSDKDGIADNVDKCPATPNSAKVDDAGCPVDTDKDGVADYMDKCPEEAGVYQNSGCPEVKAEVIQLFAQALTGVKFETGKDIIKAESFDILDNVVKVMIENPSYNLRITGHTDNVGDAAKNLDLSDRRTKAVQKYLVDHGVSASRILSAEGKGDAVPVADNNTKEGRAQNRRVEFKVEF